MLRALLYELTNRPQMKLFVLHHGQKDKPSWAYIPNVFFAKKYSLKGFWCFFRSKHTFYTTGLFSTVAAAPNQVVINLWHGMPIKVICNDYHKSEGTPKFTYTIATSSAYKKIIARAFDVKLEKVLLMGLPRNDLLFIEAKRPIKELFGTTFNKIILWLPTYRESSNSESSFLFDDFDFEGFGTMMEENNILCIVKPHPLSKTDTNDLRGSSHVKFITDDWLLAQSSSLYELLSQTDILITDISSVYIDYLLLEKPILFCFPDIDNYQGTRKIYFDNLPEYLPGPLVYSYEKLIEEINQLIIGNDNYVRTRLKLLDFYHENKKPSFTKMLLKELGI